MTASKTIAALLGHALVASAIPLLANLGTSRTIIEGLSQSSALIMIAGYAAFVPPSSISTTDGRGGWPVGCWVSARAFPDLAAHSERHDQPSTVKVDVGLRSRRL
jgi:hypothetical protein